MTYQYELDGAVHYLAVPIEDDIVLRWHLQHPLARCRKPPLICVINKVVEN